MKNKFIKCINKYEKDTKKKAIRRYTHIRSAEIVLVLSIVVIIFSGLLWWIIDEHRELSWFASFSQSIGVGLFTGWILYYLTNKRNTRAIECKLDYKKIKVIKEIENRLFNQMLDCTIIATEENIDLSDNMYNVKINVDKFIESLFSLDGRLKRQFQVEIKKGLKEIKKELEICFEENNCNPILTKIASSSDINGYYEEWNIPCNKKEYCNCISNMKDILEEVMKWVDEKYEVLEEAYNIFSKTNL